MESEDDNLMPNDSTFWFPQEPKEQILARKKEKAQTLEAIKVLDQIIAHFDERIAYRDSLDSLNSDLAESVEMHQKKCEVNKMLKLALTEERDILIEKIEMHAPNR